VPALSPLAMVVLALALALGGVIALGKR